MPGRTFTVPGMGSMQSQFMNQPASSENYFSLAAGLPEVEQKAYQDSGLQGVFTNPELGQVPTNQMNAFYDLAQGQALDTGRQAINSQFGENGMAPNRGGPQAEFEGRMGTNIALARAQGMVQNSARGATTQAGAQQNIGSQRYNVLTRPAGEYYSSQVGGGAGSSLASGQGGRGYSPFNSGPSMGSAAGLSSSQGQTPWWQTSYQSMPAANPSSMTDWNANKTNVPGFSPQSDTPDLTSYLKSISQGRDAYGGT